MSWFNKGKKDAQDNKGQKDPNSFKTDAERKNYQAGWHKGNKK